MQNYKLKGKYEYNYLILLDSKPDSNDLSYTFDITMIYVIWKTERDSS